MLRISHCLNNRLTVNCEIQRESERQREKVGEVVVRDTTTVGGGGVGNNIFGLKVPRHCPLVLLIVVRHEFRINSTFFLMLVELEGLH
jgi:hypothetical protein